PNSHLLLSRRAASSACGRGVHGGDLRQPLARRYGRGYELAGSRLLLVCATLLACVPAAAASPQTPASVRATIDKYCVTCHNQRLRTAGLSLEALDTSDIPGRAELWEKVTARLRTGAMPPAGAPRPDAATVADIAGWVETSIDEAAARRPIPGR